MIIGDKVKVFDHLLFKDDISTPLSYTIRPATVVRVYSSGYGETLVDVEFKHRSGTSKAHFLRGIIPNG